MFRNYLKIAIRNLRKNKLHSFINISGLVIGMSVSILILSYVWYELSFDRFHSNFDRIYKVVFNTTTKNKDLDNRAYTGWGVASILKEEYPEIVHAARVTRYNTKNIDLEFSYKNKKNIEESINGVFADNDIFKIFDIELIYGDPETALLEPNSIVLTEEMATKYFGNEHPLGKFINVKRVDNEQVTVYEVTGVAKAMPVNSHFSFKFLSNFPYVWRSFLGRNHCYTYVMLPLGYPSEELENKFPEMVRKHHAPSVERSSISYDDWLESGNFLKVKLMPLRKVHLDNNYKLGSHLPLLINKGNLFQVQMYTLAAILIIFLACINFITLSTARSGSRAKEVGIRKVTGARRVQLIRQFLTESILLSVIAMIIAVIMVAVISRPFNNLLRIQTFHDVTGQVFIVTSLFVVTLLVGIIAGSYPAFFLSSFRPVSVLKGQLLEKMKGVFIRNGLVVFQFLISIVLIISSVVVYKYCL